MYPNVRYSRNSAEAVSAGENKLKGKAVRAESCCVFKSSLKETEENTSDAIYCLYRRVDSASLGLKGVEVIHRHSPY